MSPASSSIVDIAPVNAAAHQSNLQACGGCDVKLARELGADLEITGMVQKVSNLILNINVYLRDVHTGKLVAAASVDMRGNTDEVLVARDPLSHPRAIADAEFRRAAGALTDLAQALSRAACQRR